MPRTALVDAGPIVAFLQTTDQWHDWSVQQFKIFPVFVTCEAVIAEACARVCYQGNDQNRVLELVLNGSLILDFAATKSIERISRLMKKYSDQPMDFADACLVAMSEQIRQSFVVTLDREDFSIYRRHEREVIPLVAPELRR